jgi:DivIVA domain-containing protein
MQPDTGALPASLSEEAPPREFVTAMRGYDRHQVDEHIRQIEAEVRQYREQAQAMQRELSEARRQFHEQERPAYTGLGARIGQLLRLAEEQATEVVQTAGSEAGEIKATARVDAAQLRAGAENDATELARPRSRPGSCSPRSTLMPNVVALPPTARSTTSPGRRTASPVTSRRCASCCQA